MHRSVLQVLCKRCERKKREKVGKSDCVFLGGEVVKCLYVWKNRMHDIYNISSRAYQWRYTDL